MPAIIGQSTNQIFKRGFYAMQNTTTPIIVTIVQVLSNIILNGILSKYWGLNGLAAATSISSFMGGLLSIILFRIKYGKLNLFNLTSNLVKILIAASLMSFVTYYSFKALSGFNYIFALVISIVLSAMIYFVLILLARIPDVKKELNRLYKKMKRK